MSRSPSPVLVSGYYGKRNTGDDAYGVVAASMVAGDRTARPLTFTAATAELPELPTPCRGIHPLTPRFRGHQRLSSLWAMARAAAIVHLGGSTFASVNRSLSEQRLLTAFGPKQLHAIGVSVGPFLNSSEADRVVAGLARFTSISVRDRRSFELLGEGSRLHPHLGFDSAILLPQTTWWDSWVRSEIGEMASTRHTAGRLGLALCGTRSVEGEAAVALESQRERAIEVVAQTAKRTGSVVRLLVFSDHRLDGDQDVTMQARDHMVARGVEVDVTPYHRDTRRMMAAVASCDAVVGVRLHSCVFSYALEVPFLLVPYHQKCLDFADEIDLEPDCVMRSDRSCSDLQDTLERLMGGAASRSYELSLSEARWRASASLTTLSTLLEHSQNKVE